VQSFDFNEEMFGRSEFRFGPGQRTDRIDQIGRAIGCSAFIATVSVLIFRFTLRTGPFDEAIRQKGFDLGIEQLCDFFFTDEARFPECGPDLAADLAIGIAVGTAVVIELNIEARKIIDMGLPHPGDQCFLGTALLPCPVHDCRAVRVVGTDIHAAISPEFLESNPDIGLNVFDQMPQVDMPVGIRKGGSDENLTRLIDHVSR